MAANGAGDKEYFEQQRQLLVNDVAAVSLRPPPNNIRKPVLMISWAESGECATKHQQAQSKSGGRDCGTVMREHLRWWHVLMDDCGIQVGNEFGQVEGLWSQMENIMAKEQEKEENKDTKEGAAERQ